MSPWSKFWFGLGWMDLSLLLPAYPKRTTLATMVLLDGVSPQEIRMWWNSILSNEIRCVLMDASHGWMSRNYFDVKGDLVWGRECRYSCRSGLRARLHIGVTQSGWLYGSGQGLHWSDGISCPGSVPEGVRNCLWGSESREGFVDQGELAERDLEGCEYAIIKLKKREECSRQEVEQGIKS